MRGMEKIARQVARRHLVFYLRIFDGMSVRILGHVLDISECGLLLISDTQMEVNEEYRLRMKLPTQMKERREILINATSRWCRQDKNPDFYLVGFQIHDLEASENKIIKSLIAEFSCEEEL